jgi:hypothetical protein
VDEEVDGFLFGVSMMRFSLATAGAACKLGAEKSMPAQNQYRGNRRNPGATGEAEQSACRGRDHLYSKARRTAFGEDTQRALKAVMYAGSASNLCAFRMHHLRVKITVSIRRIHFEDYSLAEFGTGIEQIPCILCMITLQSGYWVRRGTALLTWASFA